MFGHGFSSASGLAPRRALTLQLPVWVTDPMEPSSNPLLKVRSVADIVFLIDATGSMKPCIEGLKDNILSFVETLTGADANNECPLQDWRIKVAGYRDAEDNPETWWEEFPFTRDIGKVRGHFGELKAHGGGDEPESLLDALHKLALMPVMGPQEEEVPDKWRARGSAHRVVIVFTDATFKPTMHYEAGKGGTLDDVFNAVLGSKITLFVFCPEHDCYHDLASYDRTEVETIGSISEGAKLMEQFTRDKANFQKALSFLAKSVSKSAAGDAIL